MGKLVSAIVLLAIVLLGLAPLSVSAQPSQPATGELTPACHAPPLEPLTPPLEVRFVEGGPTWTARVHGCASPEDSASPDPGCAVLLLIAGGERRCWTIDRETRVVAPSLRIAPRGSGAALVLVEARGLEEHADVFHLHLLEDEGSGPRVTLRAAISACSWGDEGDSCGVVRADSVVLRDLDRDGDLDLDVTVSGGEDGRRFRFVREPRGGFTFPDALRDPERYVGSFYEEIAPPIGDASRMTSPTTPAPSAPTTPTPPSPAPPAPGACSWVANDASSPLNVRASPGPRGAVVGSLPLGTRVEVAERRGRWARLSAPVAGWAWAASLEERCE